MLPEHRLAILLQQVKRHQISNCLYHNTASSPSLYQDHNCDRNHFPVNPVLELDKHTGEVWHVKFSNDGSKLATCGKDGTCLIYEVGSFEILQCLAMPETGIASVAWSPDDSMIVTCQLDYYAILWDVTVSSRRMSCKCKSANAVPDRKTNSKIAPIWRTSKLLRLGARRKVLRDRSPRQGAKSMPMEHTRRTDVRLGAKPSYTGSRSIAERTTFGCHEPRDDDLCLQLYHSRPRVRVGNECQSGFCGHQSKWALSTCQ